MEALIATKERGTNVYSIKNGGGYLIGSCTLQRIFGSQVCTYQVSDISICTPTNGEEKLEGIINSLIKIISTDTQGQSFMFQINDDPPTLIHPPQKTMPFSKQYMKGES